MITDCTTLSDAAKAMTLALILALAPGCLELDDEAVAEPAAQGVEDEGFETQETALELSCTTLRELVDETWSEAMQVFRFYAERSSYCRRGGYCTPGELDRIRAQYEYLVARHWELFLEMEAACGY